MTTPQELEEAYRDLIADLEAATALAVEKPRKLSLAQADILLSFALFLASTGNWGLIAPLNTMLNDLFDKRNKAEFGGAIKPIGETFKLASAAAAVTLLIEGGAKRDNALKQVCDKTGLDRRKLSNYRDNLIRRRVHWIALASYDLRLKHGRRSGEPGALMDAWSKAEELLLKAPR